MTARIKTYVRTAQRLLVAALIAGATGAQAQNTGLESRVIQVSSQTNSLPQYLSLSLNKAAIIELDRDVRDVMIANPEIADAVVRTPRRIFVLALMVGQTNAILVDAQGNQIVTLEINVGVDVTDLNGALDRNLPGTRVEAEALSDSIILGGTANSIQEASRAQQLATRATGDPEMVVNNIQTTQRQQVLIKVRVSEMSRSIAKQFGVNLSSVVNVQGVPVIASTGNQFSLLGRALSDLSGGQFGQVCRMIDPQALRIPDAALASESYLNGFATPADILTPNAGVPGGALNPLGVFPGNMNLPGTGLGFSPTDICTAKPNNLQSVVQALERVGLVHTLAEPNLTAISGEAAQFLAGGEFPVPTSRDRDGNVTVEFKPFGVGLSFTPVVLSKGNISLQLSTEVSELTNAGALTLGGGISASGTITQGLTLPALAVRRTQTTVQLPSGGSLAIGGLIQQQTKQNIDAFPGLKELPVLGALFRSRDFQNNETELVVTVTAYLVDPVSESQLAYPDEGFRIPSDAETLLLGRLNTLYNNREGAPAAATAAAVPPGTIGYIVQ